MIVSIHQPQYLPWIGFFHKVAQSDVFVLLDDAEYSKNDFFNRNKMKNSQGWMWLTVPVHYESGAAIMDIRADSALQWEAKHWKSLRTSYNRAPFFTQYAPFLEEFYSRRYEWLIDVVLPSLTWLLRELSVDVKIVRSSELGIGGKGTGRLIGICRSVGGNCYLSGVGGRQYVDEAQFATAGIELRYQEFIHPVYPQLFGEFIPGMSIVDLLFNCGDEAKSLVRG